jgi:ribosome-binding protein aMBF1 (putative translation factor)
MSERKKIGKRFGQNLVKARRRARMPQLTLARRASMHQRNISRFEAGLICPRLDTAIRLAGALGVQLRDLLDGIE